MTVSLYRLKRRVCGSICALTLTMAASGCGPAEIDELASLSAEIINGQACGATIDPSAVALVYSGTLQHPFGGTMPLTLVSCTGTLIAPDVVLTAGHCLDMKTQLAMYGASVSDEKFMISFTEDLSNLAQVGMTPASPPTDAVEAARWLPHPEFSLEEMARAAQQGSVSGLRNFNDIALIFLSRAITEVEPAILPSAEEAAQLVVQQPVRIVGWGQTTPQQANPFDPNAAGGGRKFCADSAINELGTHEMQIGSDINSPRKCHGDSGGPTYTMVEAASDRKDRVIGVTSRAYDAQNDCNVGGVDTRVDAHLAWIDGLLKEGCQAGIRPWCEVPGVIPASHYDEPEPTPPVDPPAETPATTPEGGDPQPEAQAGGGSGGGCNVAPGASQPPLLLLLLALLARRSRRRR